MESDGLIERLYEVSSEADLELTKYGLDQELTPSVRYSTMIPGQEAAQYDPISDVIWVALDPDHISDGEMDELRTEIMESLMKSYSVDREELGKKQKQYEELHKLYVEAGRPLSNLVNWTLDVMTEVNDIPRSYCGAPESVTYHIDKLWEGDENILNYLIGASNEETTLEEGYSNIHAWVDEVARGEDGERIITDEDVDFHLKLLESNFDYLQGALEAKRELKREIQATVNNGGSLTNGKHQAASEILPLERHGTLGKMTEEKREEFLENSETREEVESMIEEILTEIESSEDKKPRKALRDALDNQPDH